VLGFRAGYTIKRGSRKRERAIKRLYEERKKREKGKGKDGTADDNRSQSQFWCPIL
jgi:type VI protein secretion system component VasF